MATSIRVTVFAAQAVAEARRLSKDKRVEVAGQIAESARGSAPVETGKFRDSINVQQSGDEVAVVNNDPVAGYIEYGTSDTPAHATMTNAARQFGRYTGITPRGR